MNKKQIKDIQSRHDKTTQGTWIDTCEIRNTGYGMRACHGVRVMEMEINDLIATGLKEDDAIFVAAAHQDIPKLLAEVKKLNSENARLAAWLACFSDVRCPATINAISFECPRGLQWDEETCLPFENNCWRAAAKIKNTKKTQKS